MDSKVNRSTHDAGAERMSDWPINPFDAGVLLIILISSVLALIRGFTQEVLSVLAWAGAAIMTLILFPYVKPIADTYISLEWVADLVTGGVIFLASVVALSLLSHAISKRVKGSPVGPLDHTLGLIFGAVRGAALVAIMFLGVQWYYAEEDAYPDWISDARTRPLAAAGADLFLKLNPNRTVEIPDFSGLPGSDTETLFGTEDSADNADETGYKSAQRRALEQLIRTQDTAE